LSNFAVYFEKNKMNIMQLIKKDKKKLIFKLHKENQDVYDYFPEEIKEALVKFEPFFLDSLLSDSPLLNKVIQYIFDKRGKRIRPALLFLAAKASAPSKPFTDKTFAGTAAVEMIHTASIVHDDVVDQSDLRRGNKSVNVEWTSKIAVLAGDYFLAKALMLITEYEMFDFMSIMSIPIVEMSVGEMIQIEKSVDLDITEEIYFEIIRKKTAVLMGASMKVGAKTVGAEHLTGLMYEIGENIGMAFQIKDDIFDYEKTNLLGKPVGNDIVEKKITLPLIYALKQVDSKEQKHIVKLVSEASENKHNISIVQDFVLKHNGLGHAKTVAEKYIEKTIALIANLEDSPAKQSLTEFSYFMIKRKK
jgi:octaprenyl-diphosphate synthase